jgi:hypothetical protein
MKEKLKELRRSLNGVTQRGVIDLVDILIEQVESDVEANLRAHLERHDQVLCSAVMLRALIDESDHVLVSDADPFGWDLFKPEDL